MSLTDGLIVALVYGWTAVAAALFVQPSPAMWVWRALARATRFWDDGSFDERVLNATPTLIVLRVALAAGVILGVIVAVGVTRRM
jgi:hypothetical protein